MFLVPGLPHPSPEAAFASNRKPALIALIPKTETLDPRDLGGACMEGLFGLEKWGPNLCVGVCQPWMSGWEGVSGWKKYYPGQLSVLRSLQARRGAK